MQTLDLQHFNLRPWVWKEKSQKILTPKSSFMNTSLRPFILYKIESKLRATYVQIYSYSLNYYSMSLGEQAPTTNIPINLPRKNHHVGQHDNYQRFETAIPRDHPVFASKEGSHSLPQKGAAASLLAANRWWSSLPNRRNRRKKKRKKIKVAQTAVHLFLYQGGKLRSTAREQAVYAFYASDRRLGGIYNSISRARDSTICVCPCGWKLIQGYRFLSLPAQRQKLASARAWTGGDLSANYNVPFVSSAFLVQRIHFFCPLREPVHRRAVFLFFYRW